MDESTLQLPRIRRDRDSDDRLALALVLHPDLRRCGELVDVADGIDVSRKAPWFGGSERAPLDVPHLSRRSILRIDGSPDGASLRYVHDSARVKVDGRPFDGFVVLDPARLHRGVLIELEDQVALWLHRRPTGAEELEALGIVGVSEAVARLRDEIRRAGPVEASVLIRGETGAGKELVARALHDVSERRDGPFSGINVAAVAPSVLASELFGHVRGAFTGAGDARRGYVRQAHGGTLFLDEIGEAAGDVQAALLRTLETGEVIPVGADRPVRANVRFLAATDAPLEAAIEDGTFRAPLLHRLAQLTIDVPPLRDRALDIPVLFARFVREECDALGVRWRRDPREPAWMTTETTAALLAHTWPGNVRELRNVARASVLASASRDVFEIAGLRSTSDGDALPPTVPTSARAGEARPAASRRDPDAIPLEEIEAALEAADFRPEPAAVALGIARSTMYQLLKQHPSIPTSAELSGAEIEAAIASAGGNLADAARALRVPKRGLMHRMRKLGLR